MQPQEFRPPATEDELIERAKPITLPGAKAVLDSLKSRRSVLIQNIDSEISFYEKVIELKKAGKA